MHSYSSLPCRSSPPLLLITALLLSSHFHHSYHPLRLATVLLLSLLPQLPTALLPFTELIVASLPHTSSPNCLFLSSPLLLSTALLVSYSPQLLSFPRLPRCPPASSPSCLVACVRGTCSPVSSPCPPGSAPCSLKASCGFCLPPRSGPSPAAPA